MSTPASRDRAAGDPERWQRAHARCLRVAQGVLRDRADAEDAAQEALLRAWRSESTAESEPAWLSTIARNEALRIIERRRPAEPLGRDGEQAAAGDLELETVAAVGLDQLLGTLPGRDRELLRLRYLHDLTQREIATALDLPEGTVKVRLHRLRLRLRNDLRSPQ